MWISSRTWERRKSMTNLRKQCPSYQQDSSDRRRADGGPTSLADRAVTLSYSTVKSWVLDLMRGRISIENGKSSERAEENVFTTWWLQTEELASKIQGHLKHKFGVSAWRLQLQGSPLPSEDQSSWQRMTRGKEETVRMVFSNVFHVVRRTNSDSWWNTIACVW